MIGMIKFPQQHVVEIISILYCLGLLAAIHELQSRFYSSLIDRQSQKVIMLVLRLNKCSISYMAVQALAQLICQHVWMDGFPQRKRSHMHDRVGFYRLQAYPQAQIYSYHFQQLFQPSLSSPSLSALIHDCFYIHYRSPRVCLNHSLDLMRIRLNEDPSFRAGCCGFIDTAQTWDDGGMINLDKIASLVGKSDILAISALQLKQLRTWFFEIMISLFKYKYMHFFFLYNMYNFTQYGENASKITEKVLKINQNCSCDSIRVYASRYGHIFYGRLLYNWFGI